jgi:hypothetical protein
MCNVRRFADTTALGGNRCASRSNGSVTCPLASKDLERLHLSVTDAAGRFAEAGEIQHLVRLREHRDSRIRT